MPAAKGVALSLWGQRWNGRELKVFSAVYQQSRPPADLRALNYSRYASYCMQRPKTCMLFCCHGCKLSNVELSMSACCNNGHEACLQWLEVYPVIAADQRLQCSSVYSHSVYTHSVSSVITVCPQSCLCEYFVRSSMIVYDVELIPLYPWNDAWKW